MTDRAGEPEPIRQGLADLGRRLDEITAAVRRLEPRVDPPGLPGQSLDEASRAELADLHALLAVHPGRPPRESVALLLDHALRGALVDWVAVGRAAAGGGIEFVGVRAGPGVERMPADAPGPGEGLVGRALRERDVVLGSPVDRDRDPLMRAAGLARAVVLPFVGPPGGEAAAGFLVAGRRRDVPLDAGALRTLTVVADRLGLLLAEPEATDADARGAPLPAELDVDRLSEALARLSAASLGAPTVVVLVPEGNQLVVRGAVGRLPSSAAAPRGAAIATVLERRTPWVLAGDDTDPALAAWLGAPPRLVVPLPDGGQVAGLLVAGGPGPLELTRVAGLVAQAGPALRNARLYAETRAALADLSSRPARARPPRAAPARDFGSLLALVLGRLASLRERTVEGEVQRELEVIEEAAWRAAEAVRDLLGYAPGRRTDDLSPVDLGSVIQATVAEAERRWAERPGAPVVRLDLAPLPPVRGSASDLAEALDHLLENAAEAVHPGGTITVRGRWDGGATLDLTVEDRGAGMDETVRSRALDPFFSTKGAGRLGLGLPVTQAIVARHRGELDITSAPGLGTTVRVRLPTLAASGRGASARPTAGARVLIVEDEAAVREALTGIVEQLGHVGVTATDAREAMERVAREPVDVVVTDLALPGGSGLEVAREVKRVRPGTPVIVVTAWPGRLDAASLVESGVDAVVDKPVGPVELGEALGRALGRVPSR